VGRHWPGRRAAYQRDIQEAIVNDKADIIASGLTPNMMETDRVKSAAKSSKERGRNTNTVFAPKKRKVNPTS
jgi:hypothetical protein